MIFVIVWCFAAIACAEEPKFSSSLSSGTYHSARELWAAYDELDDERCPHRFATYPRADREHPA